MSSSTAARCRKTASTRARNGEGGGERAGAVDVSAFICAHLRISRFSADDAVVEMVRSHQLNVHGYLEVTDLTHEAVHGRCEIPFRLGEAGHGKFKVWRPDIEIIHGLKKRVPWTFSVVLREYHICPWIYSTSRRASRNMAMGIFGSRFHNFGRSKDDIDECRSLFRE
jgi:hypothetical protein